MKTLIGSNCACSPNPAPNPFAIRRPFASHTTDLSTCTYRNFPTELQLYLAVDHFISGLRDVSSRDYLRRERARRRITWQEAVQMPRRRSSTHRRVHVSFGNSRHRRHVYEVDECRSRFHDNCHWLRNVSGSAPRQHRQLASLQMFRNITRRLQGRAFVALLRRATRQSPQCTERPMGLWPSQRRRFTWDPSNSSYQHHSGISAHTQGLRCRRCHVSQRQTQTNTRCSNKLINTNHSIRHARLRNSSTSASSVPRLAYLTTSSGNSAPPNPHSYDGPRALQQSHVQQPGKSPSTVHGVYPAERGASQLYTDVQLNNTVVESALIDTGATHSIIPMHNNDEVSIFQDFNYSFVSFKVSCQRRSLTFSVSCPAPSRRLQRLVIRRPLPSP